MGHTKRTYEQMTIDEIVKHYPGNTDVDEDYEYELWKQRKIEQYEQELMEKEAYEQHLGDR
jgi:acyl-CoA-binding protein